MGQPCEFQVHGDRGVIDIESAEAGLLSIVVRHAAGPRALSG
jgi:hypothetical protein